MNTRFPQLPMIGPGSQPSETDGAALVYPEFPKEIATYRAPVLPPLEGHEGAASALDWLVRALEAAAGGGAPAMTDLTHLAPSDRDVVNEILGEGEVSARLHASRRARSQESILTGVWRTFYVDENDRIERDVLEVGPYPHYVADGAVTRGDVPDLLEVEAPEDVLNAPHVLAELVERSRAFAPGDPPHSLNLTLLPMNEADLTWLDETLGLGPADALSRSYGLCHVQSTRLPNVWWVRFFNSVQRLILNTIEVTDVPEVLCAAPEDLRDSSARLGELVRAYAEDHARG